MPVRQGTALRFAWRAVRWLLGLPPRRPSLPTRMTPEEVLIIAKDAARAAGYRFEPMEPQPRMVEGRLVWEVNSATIGSGWRIEIVDATGTAGPLSRWGIR